MKEAVVAQGPKVTIVDSPIPKPGRNQIVTKVIFSGSNPKDWKLPGTFRYFPDIRTNRLLKETSSLAARQGAHQPGR